MQAQQSLTMNLMNLTAQNFENTDKPKPQRPPDDPPLPPRKRDRKSLNCVPCKRLKVRCDRRQPCARCVRGKREESCVYEPDKKEEAKARPPAPPIEEFNAAPAVPAAAEPTTIPAVKAATLAVSGYEKKAGSIMKYRDGKTKYLGGTHWGNLIKQFHDVQPFQKRDIGPSFLQVRFEMKQMKKAFMKKRNVNYPFAGETRPLSTEEALSLLPSQPELEGYIEVYLRTFERTHRILHIPTFKEELAEFWVNRENVDLGWLSQVFMMAAVGCHVQHILDTEGPAHPYISTTVDCLLEGAQGCLTAVKFMWKPKTPILRTLCIMTIAKQMDLISSNESDSCWLFMGLLTRMAIAQGYHRDPTNFENMPAFDQEMRRRVWCTIVYMELQHALDNGMPLSLQERDTDCIAGPNVNDAEFSRTVVDPMPSHSMDEFTESTLQIFIYRSFPIVMKIVADLNSAEATIPYEKTLQYDAQIREELDKATKVFDTASEAQDYVFAQRTMFEMMYRRLLLVLHRPYFSQANAKEAYPESYYAALDCSLALLFQKGNLILGDDTKGMGSMTWLAEVMKDEYIDSALTVCVELRRNKAQLKPGTLICERPVETVFATLHACRDIAGRQMGLSLHHMKEHMGLGVMIGALEAPETAEDQWTAFVAAAKETIALAKIALQRNADQETESPMDSVETGGFSAEEISPEFLNVESDPAINSLLDMAPEYYITKTLESAVDFEVDEYFPAFPLLWGSLDGKQ